MILSLGNFDVIDLCIAVDACRLMGDEKQETKLLWFNRRNLEYGHIEYCRDMLKQQSKHGSVAESLNYYRNELEYRNQSDARMKGIYLDILHSAGQAQYAYETASVLLTDKTFLSYKENRKLVEAIIKANSGKPLEKAGLPASM